MAIAALPLAANEMALTMQLCVPTRDVTSAAGLAKFHTAMLPF
jgi:hypothetical protein